jgi:hemerythrin HHE cation binding domain-containing protein
MLVEIIHQQHLEIRELFARHQEALLQSKFEEARNCLNNFNIFQKAHMQIEEKYLFPKFAKIKKTSRWDVSLYEKEHDKISKLYNNISNDLDWLSEQELGESDKCRNIIALLDKEKTLKGLSEHHEEREEEAMLKELDEQLEQRQLKELKLDIKLTWAEVVASVSETTA